MGVPQTNPCARCGVGAPSEWTELGERVCKRCASERIALTAERTILRAEDEDAARDDAARAVPNFGWVALEWLLAFWH